VLQDRRSNFVQGKTLVRQARALPGQEMAANCLPARTLRVGNDLRSARERLDWDLDAIAAYLRIRPAVLSAIEDGRLTDLPPGAYAVGFLRSYAKLLGLDPDDVTRRFRAEAAGLTRKPELDFPAPVPDRGVPAGAVVLMGALLAVGAYAGWYRMSDSRPGEPPVRQVPQRLADLVKAPPAPVEVPTPPRIVAEAPPPQPPPVLPSVPPTSAAAAIPAAGVFGPPLSATPVPPGAGLPPLPEGTRIVLRAKADTWLMVRDRQGRVLLNRVLRTGETWPVPPGKQPAQLLLSTGNASGTEVLVDGQLTASLGNDGVVRHDLPLDPDAIRDGRLAPPVVAARR
jgi:cytoskeleton protein RodZ